MTTSVRSFVLYILASCFLLTPTSGFSEEYKILVIGDSLGQGLGFGMARCLSRPNSFYVVNKGKTSSKLTNVRPVNWLDQAQTLSLGGFDAVVVQIGANDIMGIRSNGARVSFGSPQWHTEYKSRVIEITQSFQKKNIPIIWVGVPYPRKVAWRKPYSLINDAIKAGAASAGAGSAGPVPQILNTPFVDQQRLLANARISVRGPRPRAFVRMDVVSLGS